jgi:hypothetical protein
MLIGYKLVRNGKGVTWLLPENLELYLSYSGLDR